MSNRKKNLVQPIMPQMDNVAAGGKQGNAPAQSAGRGDNSVINGIRINNEADPNKVISVAANDGKTGEHVDLSYTNYKVIGNGSFGVVFQAKIIQTGEYGAIKKVLQDKRFKVGLDA